MAHSQITPEQISIIRTLVPNAYKPVLHLRRPFIRFTLVHPPLLVATNCIEVTCKDGTKRIVNTKRNLVSPTYTKRQSTGCPHVVALEDAIGNARFLHTKTMESTGSWSITSFTQVSGLPVLELKYANGATRFLHTETMGCTDWRYITSFTQVPGLPVLELKDTDGDTIFLHTETMESAGWFSSWSVINPSHPHIIRIEVDKETYVYNLLSMKVLQVYTTERLVSIDIVDGEIVVTQKEVLIPATVTKIAL